MRTLFACCMTAAAIASATPGLAQEAGSRQTREFVQAAGQSDQFEIRESQAALTQSADPRVRAFAQQMIAHHGETMRMLGQAAASAGLRPPPMVMSSDQAALLGGLQGLHGEEFDRTYARQQALAHRSALVVEQGYAQTGDDPAVRQAAAAAVPVISDHLAAAERLRAALGGP